MPERALLFENCRDVCLKGMAIYGFVTEGLLMGVRSARTVIMHDLELEASGPASTEIPRKLLDLHPALATLYETADRNVFDKRIVEVSQALSALSADERRKLAAEIVKRLEEMSTGLSTRENRSFGELINLLRQPAVSKVELAAVLGKIRLEAVREHPAVALAIDDAGADWTLGNCDILGIVILYGTLPSGPLPAEMVKALDSIVKEGRVTFGGLGTTLRAAGCRMTRIDVSTAIRQRIADIIEKQGGTLPALFSSALLSDLTLLHEDSQMVFLNASLSSSVFEVSSARAAVVVGSSTIYVGNRGEGEVVIMDITPQGRSERAANLGISISG